ncbi:DUF4352 domain-containing protein [Oscillochloris sp. ZM17-4]|uniref:DUF4352 domain-containing protein n=1 Tax=Oscillochloris sp. ZM17-4 TaxID=2866714 RepID=UPI002105C43A|nr:DUF4352 domain-containing protein [Oscillochloris sp. ZM17-4]
MAGGPRAATSVASGATDAPRCTQRLFALTKTFIAVELLVLNQGAQSANLSTLAQMSLKDGEGRRYTIDLLAAMAVGGAAPQGELAPGETVRGPVGFQVLADASGLLFIFDGDIFGAGKVFVQLP